MMASQPPRFGVRQPSCLLIARSSRCLGLTLGRRVHAPVKSRDIYAHMKKALADLMCKAFPELSQWRNPDGSIDFEVLKAIYGLAEAARMWFLFLTGLLRDLGFKPSEYDKALYIYTSDTIIMYILIYVDDLLIIGNSSDLWDKLLAHLKQHLKGLTIQMGPDIHFLKLLIEVQRQPPSRTVIYVSRIGYLQKLLEKHNVPRNYVTPCTLDVLEAKPCVSLPEYSLSSKIMEIRYLDDVRPDIKFTVSLLTMNMHKPTTEHDQLADRVLGYLKRTSDYRMRFSPENLQLHAYVDASYAIHPDCRSHQGAIIRLGSTSAPFHAKSSVIKNVVRSSTEAEIFAANDLVSDLLWAIDLMTELGFPQQTYEDNQAVVHLLTAPDFNFQTRSKHIRDRYSFLREQLESKTLTFIHVPSPAQQSDGLTKPLVGNLFQRMVQWLMGFAP